MTRLALVASWVACVGCSSDGGKAVPGADAGLQPDASLAMPLVLAVANISSQTIGSVPNRIYGQLETGAPSVFTFPSRQNTYDLAWGDFDDDGDLDLALANGGRSAVYRNDAGTFSAAWTASVQAISTDVAWGDFDGDGDLDLAFSNLASPGVVYRNDSGTFTLAWSTPETDNSTSVAWVDFDGDHDVDLVITNGLGTSFDRIYRNTDGVLALAWTSPTAHNSMSQSWGDYDGDGDYDWVVGRYYEPTEILRNDGGGTFTSTWSDPREDLTWSVAWGDFDRDGDLDLVLGNRGQGVVVYRNELGTMTTAWATERAPALFTTGVAWADYDGDGDLDLAVGNEGASETGQAKMLFEFDGTTFVSAWTSAERDPSRSLAWSIWDPKD